MNEHGQTPLIHATIKGQSEAVSLLLGRSNPVSRTDHCGKTALYYALKAGHPDITLLLLEKKASPWSTPGCRLDSYSSECMRMLRNARRLRLGLALAPVLRRVGAWNRGKHRIAHLDFWGVG